MKLSILWLPAVLSACSEEPRASTYFAVHPDEAAQVVEACEAGSHRGAECQNAEAAIATLKRDARMARYKKAFE